jgi:uncharacterized protein (DUF885 family)
MSDSRRPDPFADVARDALASMLRAYPVEATYLGAHEHDHQLGDPAPSAARARAAQLRAQLERLDQTRPSSVDERVDTEVLRTALRAELFGLEQIREAEWNPMEHNPGPGIHSLISRDFAPAAVRLAAVVDRLAAVPAYLQAARERLDRMSGIHITTALAQFDGTLGLIDQAIPQLAGNAAGGATHAESSAEVARTAVIDHMSWLRDRLPDAYSDARLGPELFRAKLALTLDTEFDPETLLNRAEADVERITAAIVEEAGRAAGAARPDAATVRTVLDDLARDVADDHTVLSLCRAALESSTRFVQEHELVTVFDDPVDVVEMPEVDRGVAVAYCREPGPLETAALATEFAVSPAPADWDARQVASFYREYNQHMLHNLAVHEAMPGHALQLMHAKRHRSAGSTVPVRAVWGSGSFIEGWAVYSEQLMADHGYRADVSPEAARGLRMQQLKMALRTTINAIVDIRFHCHDLTEEAALDLMVRRGYQERGEADGKWRRLQLTSTQLCTYYVGYREVLELAGDLRTAHPTWSERALHDAMLGQGSPPARHLRSLLLDAG